MPHAKTERTNGRRHPKAIGDTTQAHVLARLVEQGMSALVPWGENQRYDLATEDDGAFLRIQCKTGRLRRGVIRFNTCSTTYHHPGNRGTEYYQHDYRGDADVFAVYCPDTNGVYLVPVDEVGTREGSLRVEPTRNNQSCGIRWAREFELRPKETPPE